MLGLLIVSAPVAWFLTVMLTTYRRDRVAGDATAILVSVLVVFPMHLINSKGRHGELGALVIVTVVLAARRGLGNLDKGTLSLVVVYLGGTWYATYTAHIIGAKAQMVGHTIVGLTALILGGLLVRQERRTIARTILLLASAEAVYALYELAAQPAVLWASAVPQSFNSGSDRLPNEILEGQVRAQGTFGHPLLLEMFLLTATAVGMRYDFRTSRRRVGFFALMIAGSLAAGSRSGTALLIILLLSAAGARRLSSTRAMVAVGALVLLAWATSFTSTSVYQRFSQGGSLEHRQGALASVPRLLGQPHALVVWGNGWYSTPEVAARNLLQLDGFMAIDNQFVALLVTSGLIGIAVFACLIARSVTVSRPECRLALLAIFAMFLAFDVLEFPSTWALLALLLGMATSQGRSTPAEPPDASSARSASFSSRKAASWA